MTCLTCAFRKWMYCKITSSPLPNGIGYHCAAYIHRYGGYYADALWLEHGLSLRYQRLNSTPCPYCDTHIAHKRIAVDFSEYTLHEECALAFREQLKELLKDDYPCEADRL